MDAEIQETMNTGWIKIDRKIKNWQHYQEPSVMLVWIDLLLSANTGEMWHHGQKLHRGELRTSVATIAESTGLNPKTVRLALKKLDESGEITMQTTNHYTQIFVKQFGKYQCSPINGQQDGAPNGHKQELKNKRININKPPTPLQGDAPEPPEKPIVEQPAKPAREKAHAVTRYDRVWEEIYTKLTANTFFWTQRENVAVQSIVGRITKMMDEAGRDPTDTEKENAMRWFVESLWQLDDQWIRTNFVPHVIDGKFNEYYNQLKQAKNGKPKHNTAGNPTGVSADYLARLTQQLSGEVQPQ